MASRVEVGKEYVGKSGYIEGKVVTALDSGVETFWSNSTIRVRRHNNQEVITVTAADLA